MLEQAARRSVRDWNSVRNNDHAYGFQHVERITRRLQEQSVNGSGDMQATLLKLRTIFIDPKDLAIALPLGVLDTLVKVLDGALAANESSLANLAAECLAQASARSVGLTHLIGTDKSKIEVLVSDCMAATDKNVQEYLVSILLNVCQSTDSAAKELVASNRLFMETLIKRKCYELLQVLDEAAIQAKAVELCCQRLRKDSAAVRCLSVLSFNNKAKEIAIDNGAIKKLIDVLGSFPKAEDASAALALTNILVVDDMAKSKAIEAGVLDVLGATSLRRLCYPKQLCVLKLWQILVTHPVGRKYCRQNQGVSGEFRAFVEDASGKSTLAIKNARRVLQLIDWDP